MKYDNRKPGLRYTLDLAFAESMIKGIPLTTTLFTSVLVLLWGLWTLNPFLNTFVGPAFTSFEYLAPEWVWGLGVFLFGLASFDSTIRGKSRTWIHQCNFYLWFTISLVFFSGNLGSTAFVAYLVLSFYNAFCYYVLKKRKDLL